jgi:hypothetical protein
VDAVDDIFKHTLLIDVLPKYAVEYEGFSAPGCVYN